MLVLGLCQCFDEPSDMIHDETPNLKYEEFGRELNLDCIVVYISNQPCDRDRGVLVELKSGNH